MAKLIYAANTSLDGWTEDADGGFTWAPPDDEVFATITEVMRSAGTYLYGRRMYETMAPWETDPSLADISPLTREYARVWQAAAKVVYSTTLHGVTTRNTQLVSSFDPEAVRAMKDEALSDLLIGGPHLAALAFADGLVDECHLFVWPIVLGGRNPALPNDRRMDLELVEERRLGNDVLHLTYRPL